MRPLSDYLLKERSVERADSVLIELDADAGVVFPASSRVMLHVVLHGSAVIKLEESGSTASEALNAGEYAILFYGDAHSVQGSGRCANLTLFAGEPEPQDEPPLLTLGRATGSDARVISSALSLARALPSYAVPPLPKLLPFRDAGDGFQVGRRLPIDLGAIEAACRGPGASAFLHAFANLLLFQGIRNAYSQTTKVYPVALGAPIANTIAATIRIMQAHPDKPWTVAQIAKGMGLSRSAFAAKFRAHVGRSPMEYLTEVRMKYAADLLRSTTDMPLWEVGKRVGYQDESSFARAFKLRYGVSPRAYAKKLGQPG
jgi:AraC-like DNA-binding protein